jgi:hypothetical protein
MEHASPAPGGRVFIASGVGSDRTSSRLQERFAVKRALSGNTGQAWQVKAASSASLSKDSCLSVSFPPAIRPERYKSASHVNEALHDAAHRSIGSGAVASTYPETRIL